MEGDNFRVGLACILLLSVYKAAGEEIVSPELKAALSQKAATTIMISFNKSTKDALAKIQEENRNVQSRGQKLENLESTLTTLANESHAGILKLLLEEEKKEKTTGDSKIKFGSLWLTNQVYVQGATLALVDQLAKGEGVRRIEEARVLKSSAGDQSEKTRGESRAIPYWNKLPWGIKRVNAPQAWELGFDGTGVLIGILDQGVQGTHDLLRENYVGTSNRGWYDPENITKYPYEPKGDRGTPAAGTILGQNGVGVAPGAKWMACKVTGYREEYLQQCLQFFLCPTDYQGNNKNCSAAPHILHHGWAAQASIAPGDFLRDWMAPYIGSGIHSVFSAENEGPDCKMIAAPARFAEFIGVGSSDLNNKPRNTTGTGPTKDGMLKPDVSAPGVFVVTGNSSSFNDRELGVYHGSFAAAPHVTGVIALMLQKNPFLTQDEVIDYVRMAAVKGEPSGLEEQCGEINERQFPNFRMGFGVIDALKAVTLCEYNSKKKA